MKLNKEFIEKVSKSKGEPEWMLEFRLKSFEKFLELDNPSFGPKLDIDFDKINYYKKISDVTDSWDNVDKDIKKKDLSAKAGVSPATITKMGKGGHVTTEVLLQICTALDCGVDDIMEIVPDGSCLAEKE